MKKSQVFLGLASTLALSVSGPIAAQGQSARVIEEIIVTASKRESPLQETAIAITALDADMLDMRGITGIEGLQFAAPNLVISHNSQSPVTYAYIRGIGSDQLVAGFDPGVAYHVDGIYIGQPSSMPGDFWDMERVEVLRGPQGTLYGRNSTGGSINVITRDPEHEFDAVLDVTGGNYSYRRIRGAVGGGLAEGISGRVAVISERNDGFQKNLIGRDGDRIDHWGVRGKLKFDLSEDVDIVITAQRFENEGNQSQKRREPFGPVELAPGFVLNVYEGAIPNPDDPRVVAKDHREELDLTNTLFAVRARWGFDLGQLGPVELVSHTGGIRNRWFQTSDIDMSSNSVQIQDWNMRTTQFSQELQLMSVSDSGVEWILGAFYYDEDLSTDYVFRDTSIAGFDFNNGGDLSTRSTAIYGQLGYDFREGGLPLKLTGGLRSTRDRKKIDEFQIIPQFGVDVFASSRESWREVSGKVELNWFVNEDLMAYTSYSRGYKGGGFSIGQFDTFDPETVDAYEIGIKSQFLDNRARVNVAAFYKDYKDLQVNFLEFTSFTTDNAADSTIKGIELEGTVLATDSLTLHAMATWLDATFDSYQFTPEISLDGERMNRAPKYSFGLGASQEWHLPGGSRLVARADYYWQDSVFYRVQNVPRHRGDSFHTADARLVWTSVDERWTVDAFVTNFTNQDNQRGLTVSDGLSTGNNSFISLYPPRQYGLRVGWQTGR